MKRLFRRHAGSAGKFGGVDLTNDVGKFCPRSESLNVPLVPRPPADRDFGLRTGGHEFSTDARDRLVRVLVQWRFRVLNIRDCVIEEPRKGSHQAAFPLPLFAKKKHIMTGDQGDVDLGNDRILVAHNSRKERRALCQCSQKIVAYFLFDRLRDPATASQLFKIFRSASI